MYSLGLREHLLDPVSRQALLSVNPIFLPSTSQMFPLLLHRTADAHNTEACTTG